MKCGMGCFEHQEIFVVGQNDLALATKLVKAGASHRKFMRQIVVYVDITAPLYWWKEFDTYKVGTVANSCSTMHKIHDKEFTEQDFSCECMVGLPYKAVSEEGEKDGIVCMDVIFEKLLWVLNTLREEYLRTKDKRYWYTLIQTLPTSYNQKRTVMLNYETLLNILDTRAGHKLYEWRVMVDWIQELPYAKELFILD
jgi:hypothetical protein